MNAAIGFDVDLLAEVDHDGGVAGGANYGLRMTHWCFHAVRSGLIPLEVEAENGRFYMAIQDAVGLSHGNEQRVIAEFAAKQDRSQAEDDTAGQFGRQPVGRNV